MPYVCHDDDRPFPMTRRVSLCLWVGLVTVVSGCQCWGPGATCLRPEGPIVGRAETLRQQHLERSHYYREVPMFEQYLDGGPDPHQQTPSRFHPVPTRNVFQSPTSGIATESVMEPRGHQPMFGPAPGRSNTEELPPPQRRTLSPDTSDASPVPSSPGTQSLDLGPQAMSDLLHREVVQYPYATDTQQRVADWVHGSHGSGTRESLRLHSALRTPASDLRYR
ncbi:MAG: hypothetical protein Q8M16_04210 [Pirellulaceae bacterium]|nr:hypothetical protein [Pirellulaceae bacterium]